MHVEDFARQYGTKTNEEVLRLARDLEHLTPEASVALTAELAKRGVDGTEGMNVFSDEKEQGNPSSFFFLHRHGIGERPMDVLHFLGHLALSTLGVVGVAAPVLTYSVVLSLHAILPSLGTQTVHWILTETPFFPVQIVVGLLWGFQLGRRLSASGHGLDVGCARSGHYFLYPVCAASVCSRFGSGIDKDRPFLRMGLSSPKPLF